MTSLADIPTIYLGMTKRKSTKGEYKTRPIQFNLRFKQEELDLIRQAADQAGQDTSNWIRGVLMKAARRELKT